MTIQQNSTQKTTAHLMSIGSERVELDYKTGVPLYNPITHSNNQPTTTSTTTTSAVALHTQVVDEEQVHISAPPPLPQLTEQEERQNEEAIQLDIQREKTKQLKLELEIEREKTKQLKYKQLSKKPTPLMWCCIRFS